jgi:Zn-dependent protease with chaperone function
MRPRPSLQVSGLLLYLLTVVIEAPVMLLRLCLVFFFVEVPLRIAGDPPLSIVLLCLIALAPTLWSMFALISPAGSGWWWRQYTGGREPSQRERLAYQDAVERLQAESLKPLRLPSSWFVVDEQFPNASACGDSLMLSRGLLETEHPGCVLGHELNHLGSLDGRINLALNRLVIHQAPRPSKDPEDAGRPSGERRIIRFARGGLALRITAPLWGRYWRGREYAADAYAASLGQADKFADFLEINALSDDRPIPFIALTDTGHPYTELRIDRLRNYDHEPIPQTARLKVRPRRCRACDLLLFFLLSWVLKKKRITHILVDIEQRMTVDG